MTPSNTPFTAIYARWLESFRALIPGHAPAPAAEPTPKQEEAAAKEEWEDEGGSLKP